jgi:hypothetical protein
MINFTYRLYSHIMSDNSSSSEQPLRLVKGTERSRRRAKNGKSDGNSKLLSCCFIIIIIVALYYYLGGINYGVSDDNAAIENQV